MSPEERAERLSEIEGMREDLEALMARLNEVEAQVKAS